MKTWRMGMTIIGGLFFILLTHAGTTTATVPLPLVEFLFDEVQGTSVTNTGTLGGSGTFTSNGIMCPVFSAAGVGVGGRRCMDNTSAAAMGGSGGYLKLLDNDALDGLKSFTVTFWMNKSSAFPTNLQTSLVSKNAGSISGWDVFTPLNTTNKFFLRTGDGVKGQSLTVASSAYALTNQWVFCAMTFDGSASPNSTNNGKFYAGTTNSTVAFAGAGTLTNDPSGTSASDLHIGSFPGSGTGCFRGLIDNVRIWGSKTDASGVLDSNQLASVQAYDIARHGERYRCATYSFEELEGGAAPLAGQDNWGCCQTTWTAVDKGLGLNTSKVLGGWLSMLGPNYVAEANRPHNAAFSFPTLTGAETDVIAQCDIRLATNTTVRFSPGATVGGNGVVSQDNPLQNLHPWIECSSSRFYFYGSDSNSHSGSTWASLGYQDGDWVRLQLRMNFSGNTASLHAKKLTTVELPLTNSVLGYTQVVAPCTLGVPTDINNPRHPSKWNTLYVYLGERFNVGTGRTLAQLDNLAMLLPSGGGNYAATVYTCEGLTGGPSAALNGQDGWAFSVNTPNVVTVTNNDVRSRVATCSVAADCNATRAYDFANTNFAFPKITGGEGLIRLQFDAVYHANMDKVFFGVLSNGAWGPKFGFYIVGDAVKFTVAAQGFTYTHSTGSVASNGFGDGDVIRMRLVIDPVANGGAGTGKLLARKLAGAFDTYDVAMADDMFAPVAGLEGVNLLFTSSPAVPKAWNKLFFGLRQGASPLRPEVDNFTMLVPAEVDDSTYSGLGLYGGGSNPAALDDLGTFCTVASSSQVAAVHSAGMTCWVAGFPDQTQTGIGRLCTEAELNKTRALVAAFENDPTVVGWYLTDEPAHAIARYNWTYDWYPSASVWKEELVWQVKRYKAMYDAIKSISNKPVLITAQGWEPKMFHYYRNTCDILGWFDYPYCYGDSEFPAGATDHARVLGPLFNFVSATLGKSWMWIPQAFADIAHHRLPTYNEERWDLFSQANMSLCAGVIAFSYSYPSTGYPGWADWYSPNPSNPNRVWGRLADQWNTLDGALCGGRLASGVTSTNAEVRVAVYYDPAGRYYVMANNVSTNNQTTQFGLNLPWTHTNAVVLFETGVGPRAISTTGIFSDTLTKFAVRVYRLE